MPIILKAIEPNPARRYASVPHLAEDIVRHLEKRPVQACRQTWAYRAERFGRAAPAGGRARRFPFGRATRIGRAPVSSVPI